MAEDRQVQRTRESLQNALIDLLQTRPYDSVTISDITERANVGRTTFYLHYVSKDDLFRQAHWQQVARVAGESLTREELLADSPPARMVAAYSYHWENRDLLLAAFFGRDSDVIFRQIRDHNARQTAAQLRVAFLGDTFIVPVEVLANFLAVAEMGLMRWWMETRGEHTPEQMAFHFHVLRRGSLLEAILCG